MSVHVKGSPIRSISWREGECSAAHCSAQGPGLQGGLINTPLRFTVYPRDRFGNPLQDVPAKFMVRVTGGPDKGTVIVSDAPEAHGGVGVQYELKITGTYLLCVQLSGQQIQGSPFRVTLKSPDDSNNMLLRTN